MPEYKIINRQTGEELEVITATSYIKARQIAAKKYGAREIRVKRVYQRHGRLLDFTKGARLISPCEALIPEGVTNILVNVTDGQGNRGTIEVGTDGFCQAVILINGNLYKFYTPPRSAQPQKKAFIEKIVKLKQSKLGPRTAYERAIEALRAHAGYTETRERIFKFFEEAGITTYGEKVAILNRLIEEGKIEFDPNAPVFPYTLKFIAEKEEKGSDS